MFVDQVREYLTDSDNDGVVAGLLGTSVVLYIICAILVYLIPNFSKRYPANIILLFIITLATSVLVAVICSAFQVEVVMIALAITILCCAGIFFFSFNTKYDLHSWQGILFCIFWGILSTAILIPVPYSDPVPKVGRFIPNPPSFQFRSCDSRCILTHSCLSTGHCWSGGDRFHVYPDPRHVPSHGPMFRGVSSGTSGGLRPRRLAGEVSQSIHSEMAKRSKCP